MAEPTTPATGTARSRTIDAAIVVEGINELVRGTLSELLNPDKVDAAMTKVQKLPAYKAMMAKLKSKPKGAAKGQVPLRNSYAIFVQDFLAHVKAAGHTVTLMEASSIWRVLPAQLKQELSSRYSEVKEAYNSKLQAGESVTLEDEMAVHAEANDLEPVDYVSLYSQYKGIAANTPAAAENGGAKTKGKGSGKATPAVETPSAAAAASAGKRAPDASAEGREHKKHRKDKPKKDKRDKADMKDKKGKKQKREKKGQQQGSPES